jgi:hypothetical protein
MEGRGTYKSVTEPVDLLFEESVIIRLVGVFLGDASHGMNLGWRLEKM